MISLPRQSPSAFPAAASRQLETDPAHWCHSPNFSSRMRWPAPFGFMPTASISASTMMRTKSLKRIFGSHSKSLCALLASPTRDTTSAGRKYSQIQLDILPPVQVEVPEGFLHKLTNRMCLPGPQHVIGGSILLQDSPHAFHVLRGITPITAGIQVSQIELSLCAGVNSGYGAGDFSGHEGFSPTRAFMIEKNSVGTKHPVCFP